MNKLLSWYKVIVLVLIFSLGSITPTTFAADINQQLQNQLNGLVTPKLINETKKQQLIYQGEEHIDPQTGALSLRYTDVSLPGKHGLDLNITSLYNSSKAEMGRKYTTFQPYSTYTAYYAKMGCYQYGIPNCGELGDFATAVQADQAAIALRQNNHAYDYHIVKSKAINTGYYLDLYNWNGYYAGWIGPYNSDAEARQAGDGLIASNGYYVFYISQSYQKQEPTNNIDPVTYMRSQYDLGSGWSFGFPSLEMYTENGTSYKFFHDGSGGSYAVDLTLGGTNLVDYQSKTVRFVADNGSFTVGTQASAYLFESTDKQKTYFASDGSLMGIVNPFGDTIKFEHTNTLIQGRNSPLISKITDTVGRTVNFVYENSADGNYSYITLTVVDPTNASNTVKYKYTKIMDDIGGVKQPKLWKKTIAAGSSDEVTLSFDYDLKPVTFNYSEKRLDGQTTMTGLPASTIYMHALKKVVSPLSNQYFTYENVNRNLGAQGMVSSYRAKTRYDTFNKTSTTESAAKNTVTYNYTGDYTGYGTVLSEDSLGAAYTYSSEAVRADGKKELSTFNGLGQSLISKTTATNNEQQITTNQTFDPNFKYLSTKTELSEVAATGASNLLYTAREYYDWGKLKSETRALSAADLSNATVKSLNTSSYEYDPVFRNPTSVKSYQNSTTLLTQSYSYDDKGRVKTDTNPNNETTTYDYQTTSEGEVETVTLPIENGKTAKTVTVKGAGSLQAYPTETRTFYTDANGTAQISKRYLTYDMLRGQIRTDTDNDLHATTYLYDKLGRPKQITHPTVTPVTVPPTTGENYTTEEFFTYSFIPDEGTFDTTNSGLMHYKIYNKTMVKNQTGTAKTYNEQASRYDGFGSMLTQEFYDSDRSQWITENQFHYDSLGRVIYSKDAEGNFSNASYDAWDRPYEVTDAFENLYRTDYDLIQRKQTSYFIEKANIVAFRTSPQDSFKKNVLEVGMNEWGQLINQTGYPQWPNKTIEIVGESYTYDLMGNTKNYVNPRGLTTSYAFDKLNRMVQVTDPLQQVTEYGYSVLGKLASIKKTDGTSNWTTTKTYDETGSLITNTEPGSTGETFKINLLGQNVQHTDPNQNVFDYSYDEAGRGTKTVGGPSSFVNTYKFSPFGQENVGEYTGATLIRSAALTYYATGNLKDKTVSNEGYASINAYTYDKNKRQISVKNPFNFYTQYAYDKTRIEKVQTNGSISFNANDNLQYAKYVYFPNGTLKTITYPKLDNGSFVEANYLYDEINRLKSVINTKAGLEISKFSYEYDANGNIKSVTENGIKTTYVYDNLDRLLEVHKLDGSVISYAYDVRGNRSTMQNANSFEDLRDTSYNFNSWNQLTSATLGASTVNFQYGADDGLRIKKSGSDTIRYSYNSSGKLMSESNAVNAVKANYVWGPDRLLVKQDTSGSAAKSYLYLYNGHGDVVQMVDKATGEVVNNYQYDEWGNIVSQTENVGNTFKYAGEQLDPETGLYYLRARYYDPSIGRFINKDTYEGDEDDPLSLNLYTYVENNPLTNVDPTGHWCEATVNGLYYAHSGGCNDGKGGTRTSGDGYTIDGIHNGEWEWDKGKATKQYFNPGAPHISDPTGLSQALIGCATDAYCVPGIGGMVSKTAKVATVVSTEVVKVEKTMVNFVLKLDLQLFAKSDLKQVNAAAKQVGVDRIEFGEYIHELKKSLGRKANQNFTWEELIKYAKDLKK